MRSSHTPDRIDVAFDGTQLVADAGLLLPATLAAHLGLRRPIERFLDLGRAAGRANVGDKFVTLVFSALAGGDCIDDAAALRAGGTANVLGFVAKAASTLGTFLRSFRWGHVRQLDAVSRHLLARAWAAGAGPGSAPLTIDLDSTICETYGLQKEGALHHGYTKVRGYHPLLAVAAGTGDVLMARLREGRANTARGAAHFLRETIGRVRAAGATGQLTMRADSGFYAHAVVAVCRAMDVRFSITIRQHRSVRRLIEAIPADAWTPIPYCDEGHVVIEVIRPNRQARRRHGKSDPADADAAASAVLAGDATGQPKAADATVEMIRALRVARQTAVKARTQAGNAMKALVVTAPGDLRECLRQLSPVALVRTCARFRPGELVNPTTATKVALRSLALRHEALETEVKVLEAQLSRLTAGVAPELLAVFGLGTDSAGALLVASGDNPGPRR